jgi:RNA polymerase sigma-70 factor (ECF subfamily)
LALPSALLKHLHVVEKTAMDIVNTGMVCPIAAQKDCRYNNILYTEKVIDTDWQEIQAVLNGNEEAYRQLVIKYEAQVTRMMWRFTQNRADCEQLVQDVFVEAYFSLKSYKARAPFLFWLKQIAARTGYKFWKRRDSSHKIVSLQDFDFTAKTDHDDIDADQAASVLYALLSRLPDADRLVLTLMYFDDCSIKDIAARMGWTTPAVKMRAMRARKKIKEFADKEHLWEKLGWTQ